METRKVQLTGGSTYTISLPKRWADEHGIEAGRELSLEPNGDASLVVRATAPRNDRRATARIAVDGYTHPNLQRTVEALYTVGFDEFTLSSSGGFSTAERRAVTAATAKLVGLEVLEETDARIVLTNMLGNDGESVRQSVLQLEYVTVWMHRNAVTAVANADADRAAQVIERDDEADRLFGLVNRQFHRALRSMQTVEQLGFDRPTLFAYYTTARQLERVADHAERTASVARRLEDPRTVESLDDLVTAAHGSREVVTDAASVLLGGGSVDQAYDAFTARDRLLDDLDPLDRALYDGSAPDTYLLGLVLDSARRTAEYGGNIAEAMVQLSVQAQND